MRPCALRDEKLRLIESRDPLSGDARWRWLSWGPAAWGPWPCVHSVHPPVSLASVTCVQEESVRGVVYAVSHLTQKENELWWPAT